MARRSRSALLFALAALAALYAALASHASAGTLVVRLVDDEGRALPNVELLAWLTGPREDLRAERPLTRVLAYTDAAGKAVFNLSEAGSWLLLPRLPAGYVNVVRDFSRELTRVTMLGTPDERVEVELVVSSGGTLVFELSVEGSPRTRSLEASLRPLDLDAELSLRLVEGERKEMTLPPGRYELQLEDSSALLLEEVRGPVEFVDQGILRFELEEGLTPTNISFFLRAGALVEGRVFYEGERPRMVPRALLLERDLDSDPMSPFSFPSRAEGVFKSYAAREEFEIPLQPGRWRVSLEGEEVEVDPPHVDVTLGDGGREYLEFRVAEARGPRPCSLMVLLNPEGHSRELHEPRRAVGIWPMGADPYVDEALFVQSEYEGLDLRFEELERGGSYLVVGAASGSLPGQESISDACSRGGDWQTLSLDLPAGGKAEISARDEEGEPVAGVLVTATFLGEVRRPRFGEFSVPPEVSVRTDKAGRALMTGLDAGTQRFEAGVVGMRAADASARIVGARDELVESLERRVEEDEVETLELVLVPAAAATATLFCDDGGRLHPALEARALPAPLYFEARDEAERRGESLDLEVLAEEARELSVAGIDRRLEQTLAFGPLGEEPVALALRVGPSSRWFLVGSQPARGDALVLEAGSGERASAGRVRLPCAPGAEVSLGLAAALPLEEHAGRAEARFREAGAELFTPLEATLGARSVRVAGIPHRRATLELRVEHPHLLPGGRAEFKMEARFERHVVVEGAFEGLALGGALELLFEDGPDDAAPAFLLIPADQERQERRAAPAAESAFFAALEPGAWTLHACLDAACDAIGEARGWPLTISAGETLRVRWPGP